MTAHLSAEHGHGDSRVSTGRLHDGVAWLEQALLFSILQGGDHEAGRQGREGREGQRMAAKGSKQSLPRPTTADGWRLRTSMIASAKRSFTDDSGLKNSHLA